MKPGPKPRSWRERLWDAVDVRGADECWPWLGAVGDNGFGRIGPGVKLLPSTQAHRLAYLHRHGVLPRRVTQVCGNKTCCNPDHLVGSTEIKDAKNEVVDKVREEWNRLRKLHCSAMLVQHFDHYLDSEFPKEEK